MINYLNLTGLGHFKDKENAELAPVESSSTASRQYNTGEFFWYEGEFYTATAVIPAGGTIAPNTNCKRTNISNYVNKSLIEVTTKANYPDGTVKYEPISISDGVDGIPFKNIVLKVIAAQSGEGDPSPSNVRNISGWTSANINVAGEKVFVEANAAVYRRGVSSTVDDWVYDADMSSYAFRCRPNTKYTITASNSSINNFKAGYLEEDFEDGKDSYPLQGVTRLTGAGTIVVNTSPFAKYIIIQLPYYVGQEHTGQVTVTYEKSDGTQSDTYDETYNVPFPSQAGTVYGGTLYVGEDGSGQLIVDSDIYTLGTKSVTRYTSGTNPVFRIQFSGRLISTYETGICNRYKYRSTGSLTSLTTNLVSGEFGMQSTNAYVAIRDDKYNDDTLYPTSTDKINGFKADNANLAFVFRRSLANWKTYELTAPQVKELLGKNVVTVDAGTIQEVTYYKEQVDPEEFDRLEESVVVEEDLGIEWQQGSISSTSGATSSSTVRIRTSKFHACKDGIKFTLPEGYCVTAYLYNDAVASSFICWTTRYDYGEVVYRGAPYYKFTLGKEDSSEIVPADAADVQAVRYCTTDRTLSMDGKAADAKIVGEKFDEIEASYERETEEVRNALATGYSKADVAFFTDGAGGFPVKSLGVGLTPYQNLNGYSHPWPQFGGKNLLTPFICGINISNSASNFGQATGSASASSANASTVEFIPVDFTTNEAYCFHNDTTYNVMPFGYNASFQPVARMTGASGDRILRQSSFTTDPQSVTDTTIVYVRFRFYSGSFTEEGMADIHNQLEVGTAFTTYEPPTNICPITGVTSVTVTRSGKNMIGDANAGWVSNYFINDSGGLSSSSSYKYTGNYIRVNPYTTYAIHLFKSSTSAAITAAFYNKDKVFLERKVVAASTSETESSGTFTTTGECEFVRISVPKTASQFQCECNSEYTGYEAYNGQVVNVTFPDEAGTVYGGTVDLENGTLSVNYASVDLGSLSWSLMSNGKFMYSSGISSTDLRPATNDDVAHIICSHLQAASANDVESNIEASIGIVSTNGNIRAWYPGFSTDPTQFKTDVSGWQLVYELATPVSYTIDPNTLEILRGSNSIWADTGTTSVTYIADGTLFAKKLTGAGDGMFADHYIPSDSYFSVENTLFKSISAIDEGDEIIPGVNFTKTNLPNALNASGGGGGGGTSTTYYGVCSSSGNAKEVNIDGITEITNGLSVYILFDTSMCTGESTLNINSLGAYPIKVGGTSPSIYGSWKLDSLVHFIFNESNHSWIADYKPQPFPSDFGMAMCTCYTAASTLTKVASGIYQVVKRDGMMFAVYFSQNVPANSTLSFENLFEADGEATTNISIRYRGSPITDGVIIAGDRALFMYYNNGFHLLSVDRAVTDCVAKNQGSANAGKFLVVGSDGNVTTVTMDAWQGGLY